MNDYKTVPISEHTDAELENIIVINSRIKKELSTEKPKSAKFWKAVELERQANSELKRRGLRIV
jgi:predicted patatin/cPLA2 family phospholipase